MTQETRLRVASNPTRGWQANKKTHLCVASGIRAMPETEKPPAMRVDIYSISDLMLVIMDLNKKKLPVSVTFRSEGEKMNVDFQVAQTEYDEILDGLECELKKYREEKIDKRQFQQNVKLLLNKENNYQNNVKKGLRELP